MERKTRVRFAPSPTGPLHIGGVRTALYNYLYAKRRGGDFIIRIEDTDSTRFVPGAEEYIINSLNWCGIIPDEGVENGKLVESPSERHPHAPYRQSLRRGLYRKYAEELVASGHAYYAFDSAEQLAAKRAEFEGRGETFTYNHFTRGALRNSLSMPETEWKKLVEERTDWTIRFKMPEGRVVQMDDMVRGHIEVNSDTLDDKVLWKRGDELPTYHLANIVDDHLMEITEVIRGEEWLPSLPLHYLLYEAFGWTDTMPRFAHLSLLLKPDGKGKLSKRDGDRLGFPVFPLQWVNEEGEITRGYREDGYFPEAFVNMLALLGWNPGDDRELFTIEELVEAFSIERVIKSGAKFNPDKTKWFNKEYLRKKTPAELAELFVPLLEKDGYTIVPCGSETAEGNCCSSDLDTISWSEGALDFTGKTFPKCYVEKVIELTQDRATFVADFKEITSPLFAAPTGYEPKDVAKFWTEENSPLVLQTVDFLTGADCGKTGCTETAETSETGWTKEAVGEALEGYIRTNEWPMGKVMNCLRLILTGASSGLPIADIIWLIGKTEVLRRKNLFLEAVK